jgi:hypothetical protein
MGSTATTTTPIATTRSVSTGTAGTRALRVAWAGSGAPRLEGDSRPPGFPAHRETVRGVARSARVGTALCGLPDGQDRASASAALAGSRLPVRLQMHTRLSGRITILVTRVVMAIGSAGRPCQRCELAASPAGRTPRWVVVFGSGWRLRLSCRRRHLPSLRAVRPLPRSAHRTCSLRPSLSRARLSVG